MRALLGLVVLAAACSKKSAPSASTEPDWKACEAAFVKASRAPINDRPQILLDGCHVCGDWTPLLRWNTPHDKGGPTHAEIEAAMVRCDAFCTGDSKLKFLGTLDDARGTPVRTPWRLLGEICKDKVSAVPDQRFMSPQYFALDRIARAASGRGGGMPKLAGAVEVPLPPLTIVGTGVSLPVAPQLSGDLPRNLVTYLAGDVYLGLRPGAVFTANGLRVSTSASQVPGSKITIEKLRSLDVLQHASDDARVALLAPAAAKASALIPIIEAIAPVAPVYLAVSAPGAPEGWDLPGIVPVALTVDQPTVKVTSDTTVQELANILSKQAASGASRVGVIVQ